MLGEAIVTKNKDFEKKQTQVIWVCYEKRLTRSYKNGYKNEQ